MKFKALLFAAAMAASSTAMAATPIALVKTGNVANGVFSGHDPATDFTFNLTGYAPPITGVVGASAYLFFNSGYVISSIKLDDVYLASVSSGGPNFSFQNFAFQGPLTATTHHLVITGTSLNGLGYNGQITISSAPEPAAWSLMILGVGGMGAALRTRRRRAVA